MGINLLSWRNGMCVVMESSHHPKINFHFLISIIFCQVLYLKKLFLNICKASCCNSWGGRRDVLQLTFR